MIRQLRINAEALRRISAVLKRSQEEGTSLDWRDLADIASEITAAVQNQDMRKLMEAAEDLTDMMLNHIQLPADTDMSQMFPTGGVR